MNSIEFINQMQSDIDSLMEQLQNQKEVNNPQTENIQMIIEDLQSTNLQTQNLKLECEQLTEALYSQSNHDAILTQAQINKVLLSLEDSLNQSKQQLTQISLQIDQLNQHQQSQEQQIRIYNQLIKQFCQNQKQRIEIVVKQIDQNSFHQLGKIKQFFDFEIIQSGIPLGLIIKLQIMLLKIIEEQINNIKSKDKTREELKIIILEIKQKNDHKILEDIISVEQLIILLLKSNVKLQQNIANSLNQMHLQTCQLAQQFNEQNISFQLIQQFQQLQQNQEMQLKQLMFKKSQALIENEKQKQQYKELKNQQQSLKLQAEKQIEEETRHLLTMYLKDKEDNITQIKKKYGNKYFENMIQEVKCEFKKICQKQQEEYGQSIEEAFQRTEFINEQIINNKKKCQQLIQQYSALKFKRNGNQFFQLNGIDKREYLLELQQCKISLLQIENKLERNLQIQNIDKVLMQIQYALNDIKLRIQANNIPQKTRSDSIDISQRSNRTIDHHRSQSQTPIGLEQNQTKIPHITLQLLNINLPVSNPSEIFDSNENPLQKNKTQLYGKNSQQTQMQMSFCENKSNQSTLSLLNTINYIKCSKTYSNKSNQSLKVQYENSRIISKDNLANSGNNENLNTSNNHQCQPQKKPQLKEVGNILSNIEQIQNSLKSSRTKKESQKVILNEQQNLNIMIYLQKENQQLEYDPILNYDIDPVEFGYELCRLDNQLQLFKCEQIEKIKNTNHISQVLELFDKQWYKLDNIQSIKINDCSSDAVKFQNIYDSTLRQVCVDSLALRHLKVRFFPFQLIGICIYKGLAVSKNDLEKLQKQFSK